MFIINVNRLGLTVIGNWLLNSRSDKQLDTNNRQSVFQFLELEKKVYF